MPFGETRVDQRTTGSNWSTRYSFSAKEMDEESKYHYFGARYYDSDLSIFLSVDPMASKYPSLTPYAYVANNPIKLIDPNGEEIEFNSFIDKVYVAVMCVINKDFRNNVNKLAASKETYVFNYSKKGGNDFSTDGNKLFINYDGKAKDGPLAMLAHEATHAVQFEHGEMGFENTSGKWDPVSYDLMDEVKAYDAQASWNPSKLNNDWLDLIVSDKQEKIANTGLYETIKNNKTSINNTSTEKIKNHQYYCLPHQKR
jgi:RHS repeat-associated protein